MQDTVSLQHCSENKDIKLSKCWRGVPLTQSVLPCANPKRDPLVISTPEGQKGFDLDVSTERAGISTVTALLTAESEVSL